MRETERQRDTGRGRSRFHVGEPDAGLIPGPWGHDLSQRQTLPLSHPDVLINVALRHSRQDTGITILEGPMKCFNFLENQDKVCVDGQIDGM